MPLRIEETTIVSGNVDLIVNSQDFTTLVDQPEKIIQFAPQRGLDGQVAPLVGSILPVRHTLLDPIKAVGIPVLLVFEI